MDEVQVFLGLSSFLDNIRVPLVSTRVLTRVVWLFFFSKCFCNFVPKIFWSQFSYRGFTFSLCRVDAFFFFPWDWGV